MLQQRLIGSWTLQTFEITSPAGMTTSWGANVHGWLHYTPAMTMSVAINKEIEGSPDNPQAILDSVLFYSGRYTIDRNIVCHCVDNATDPTRIGRVHLREVTIDAHQTLTVIGRGGFGTARLIWKRCERTTEA